MKPKFFAGDNIAMKVPAHEFEQTVAFYRDLLKFEQIKETANSETGSVVFKFGDKNLWIDKIPGLSQAEIWLQITTDDLALATEYFSNNKINRRDEIEPLPKGLNGLWISNPANIIHLLNEC